MLYYSPKQANKISLKWNKKWQGQIRSVFLFAPKGNVPKHPFILVVGKGCVVLFDGHEKI